MHQWRNAIQSVDPDNGSGQGSALQPDTTSDLNKPGHELTHIRDDERHNARLLTTWPQARPARSLCSPWTTFICFDRTAPPRASDERPSPCSVH